MQRVSALWQASPRKLVGALFILMLAAMMAVASGASFTSTSSNVGNVVTAGDLSMDNTTGKPGNVILNVTDLMPGDDTQGTVTLKNTGDGDGLLTLKKSGLVNSNPALPFSSKLDLVINDVTNPSSPSQVWAGKLGAMPTINIAVPVAAGAERSYQFVATFPDGGKPANDTSGDNRYKNASTQVNYDWELVSQ